MRLAFGKATLEVHPPMWLDPRLGAPIEQATAAFRALWEGAHPCITAVHIGYNEPPIAVDVAIPADGSLDLPALERSLGERVGAALGAVRG